MSTVLKRSAELGTFSLKQQRTKTKETKDAGENPELSAASICGNFFPTVVGSSTYSRPIKPIQTHKFFFPKTKRFPAFSRQPAFLSPPSYNLAPSRLKTGQKCPLKMMSKKGEKL